SSSTNWTASAPCQLPRTSESSTWFVAAATGVAAESRTAAASRRTDRTDDVYLNAGCLARVDRCGGRRASTGPPAAALHLSTAVGLLGRPIRRETEMMTSFRMHGATSLQEYLEDVRTRFLAVNAPAP